MSDFLIRYGEIALKGANQAYFLETLRRNLLSAVGDLGEARAKASFGRIILSVAAPAEDAAERLRRVFGVVSISPVQIVAPEPAAITAASVAAVRDALDADPALRTFKVDVRRADKRYPVPSMEAASEVGGEIRRLFPQLAARMKRPDLLIRVDIREQACVSSQTIPGPGGLPTGTGGRALALISGGFDSPVAAWLAARRGLIVSALHFHSFPFTSERAKEKTVDLCRVLARFTGGMDLWVVMFTDVQRAIQERVHEPMRVLVMRRMMMRIADGLAARVRAQALVTGESLGQVASQTVESIAAINAATALPVLRPLIGWDKMEIVARAQALGTYEISARPYPDCCSLFVPAHPRTQPTLAEAAEAEAGLDVTDLVLDAAARSEKLRIPGAGSRVPVPGR
ncbi:MAG TPA: tRNA uracil 4-sulfurtransferase ThiI [bacterium]|nr:tRNA uracil 4-sulfurtransferase ThiI [bacterium]